MSLGLELSTCRSSEDDDNNDHHNQNWDADDDENVTPQVFWSGSHVEVM